MLGTVFDSSLYQKYKGYKDQYKTQSSGGMEGADIGQNIYNVAKCYNKDLPKVIQESKKQVLPSLPAGVRKDLPSLRS